MADKSWNKKNDDRDLDRLFDDLNESDRKNLERVWDDSAKIDLDEPYISGDETDDALQNVHRKLGFDKMDISKAKSKGKGSNNFRYYLAAAVVLIAAGAVFMLYELKITVPHGELATIELTDGSVISLNSGTELRYNRFYGFSNRNIKLNGEAYFEVNPGEHPFLVSSNGTVTEVTGTSFNIRSWSNDPGAKTTITVLKGTVNFYPESSPGEVVRLEEGVSSNWLTGMVRPQEPDPVSVDNILAWKNRDLAFINQPLSVIFRELERKYDTTISVSDNNIERSVLTTFYSDPEGIESVLNDITTVKGLVYSKTANGYLISKN
jgi:transmembrane sensor